jgi:hypothetical protein
MGAETVKLFTGAGADIIHVGGTLANLPVTHVNPGLGTDTLDIDDSAAATGRSYYLTELGVAVTELGGDVLYYQATEKVTLRASTGSDVITIGNNNGTLDGLPEFDIQAGAGTNTLVFNDTAWQPDAVYNLYEDRVHYGPNWGEDERIASFTDIQHMSIHAGPGESDVAYGTNDFTILGMPSLTTLTGIEELDVYDWDSPTNQDYHVTELGLAVTGLGDVIHYDQDLEKIILRGGVNGGNVVNIGSNAGTLAGIPAYIVYEGGDTDTLNLKDQNNGVAGAYVVTSSNAGSGKVTAPNVNVEVSFSGVETVNLYRSLKPGTTVDKSSYNPAHYVLNVIPKLPMQGPPPEASPADADVYPPPMPMPPVPPPPMPDQHFRSVETALSLTWGLRQARGRASGSGMLLADFWLAPLESLESLRM